MENRQEQTPGVPRTIVYSTPGGVSLTLDLYRPAREAPLPVIMLVHGGGWCLGSKVGPDYARYFTEAGYLVADVEYRLAPGHLFPASCLDV